MAEHCRYCNRALDKTDGEHRTYWPFCSDRCKMAELGLWFTDRYVVSRPLGQVADDAALADQGPGAKQGGADGPEPAEPPDVRPNE